MPLTKIDCRCGKVVLEARGAFVLSAACHCADCREGSRRIEALPQAPSILDEHGGTPHVLYRRDHVAILRGQELIERLKVEQDSPERAYASCCNSYLFLDVGPRMPVLPVFRGRIHGAPPALEVRMNVKKKAPGEAPLPGDVPCSSTFPFLFVRRVLTAQLQILLRR